MRTIFSVLAVLAILSFLVPAASATPICIVNGGTTTVGGNTVTVGGVTVPGQHVTIPALNLIVVSTSAQTVNTAGVTVGSTSVYVPYVTTVTTPPVCIVPAQAVAQIIQTVEDALNNPAPLA